jgi:hypothetical protein
MMKIGPSSRLLSVVAALFLGITGAQEWGSRSSGASSWADETSFMALNIRAQGKLKIGLAFGLLALATAGLKWEEEEDPNREQLRQKMSAVDAFLAQPKMPSDSDD